MLGPTQRRSRLQSQAGDRVATYVSHKQKLHILHLDRITLHGLERAGYKASKIALGFL